MIALLLALAGVAAPPKSVAPPKVVETVKPAPKPPEPSKAVQAAPLGYLTAGELATRCSDASPAATSYCFAFIAGVHDTAQAYEQWLNQREFCAPAGNAQADLRRAFLTYISAYPKNRSGEAASVVIVALKETYPC